MWGEYDPVFVCVCVCVCVCERLSVYSNKLILLKNYHQKNIVLSF